jgi:hypothetical protein
MEKATIFKVLGGIAVATTLFALKKKSDFTKVIENMIITIPNIRNLRLRGDKILATIDLSFHNPTEYDMTILTAGLIKLKQIGLFYKGKPIGTAITTSDLMSFELPAQKSFLVKNITVELLYLTLINQWLTSGLDTDVKNYKVHIVLEALGKTWIIEQ